MDFISRLTAKKLVECAIEVAGRKQAGKKQRQSIEMAKIKAEIKTIHQARNIIRALNFGEITQEDIPNQEAFLEKLLDRLVRMHLVSVPTSRSLQDLYKWAENEAIADLRILGEYSQTRKKDDIAIEQQKMRKMFVNPSQRGKWLEYYFGRPQSTIPPFVIDPTNGARIYDPEKVKTLYLQEGTISLKAFHECPPPHDNRECKRSPIPDEEKREHIPQTKPTSLPAWWSKMYDRKAKNIEGDTWKEVMRPTSPKALRKVIQECGKGKAAGYDGISIDLIAI